MLLAVTCQCLCESVFSDRLARRLWSDVSLAGNCSLIIRLKCHFVTTPLIFFLIHWQLEIWVRCVLESWCLLKGSVLNILCCIRWFIHSLTKTLTSWLLKVVWKSPQLAFIACLQSTQICICIHFFFFTFYTLEAKQNIVSMIMCLFKVSQPRGKYCRWQHPVWCGGWVVVALCEERLMYHSSQRWARVTSILGLTHIHMPQSSCETKNTQTITNFTLVCAQIT